MFFTFDWQVKLIITYLEDFFSSVNLFRTTRLSRGFRDTKNDDSIMYYHRFFYEIINRISLLFPFSQAVAHSPNISPFISPAKI